MPLAVFPLCEKLQSKKDIQVENCLHGWNGQPIHSIRRELKNTSYYNWRSAL
jgi:hypothetical protein